MKTPSPIITVIVCAISLLIASCETYEYMRDPDAPRRAELLERSSMLAEAEASMPPERTGEDGLPIYGPAAFYDEFPEGTNPSASSLPEGTSGNSGDGSGEYERWVIGPDGLLVPASSLETDDESGDDEEDGEINDSQGNETSE